MSKKQLRNLIILLGSTTTVLAATIISPALPGMAAAFADTPNAEFLVRLTLTMPALFIAIGALFAGPLLDRLGRKPVLLISLIIYGVAGTAGYFLNDLISILVSRAVLGVAVAGVMTGFTTLILDYFSGDELNGFLGFQGAFIGLGGMVFLLVAGYLADIGWQYPFLVHLFALLLVPGLIFAIDEPQKIEKPLDLDRPTSTFPWVKLIPIYITVFLGMVIFFIFPVQVPFYLSSAGEISSSRVGLALSLNTLSSVIFALAYGWLKSRYSFQLIYGLAFLAFALNHFIISLSPAYNIVVTGLLIGGLGIGLFPPNGSGWIASVVPAESRGKAIGGMTSVLFLGQFFSPILTQPLINSFGLAGLFRIVGGLSMLIVLVFAFYSLRGSDSSLLEKDKMQQQMM